MFEQYGFHSLYIAVQVNKLAKKKLKWPIICVDEDIHRKS